MKEIKIAGKKIGHGNPCYTIAEAGANHDGQLEKAFKLIDAAILAKTDSIKFQTYSAAKLVTKNAPKYWDDGVKGETQYDVFNKLDSLNKSDWEQIFKYAEQKQITCFSTPFDEESVDLLYSLEVPAFKIASSATATATNSMSLPSRRPRSRTSRTGATRPPWPGRTIRTAFRSSPRRSSSG